MTKSFLFEKTTWIGEGKISFSISPDTIRFYTRWTFVSDENNTFLWRQEVEMDGGEEKLTNFFVVAMLTDTTFSISLENETIGKAIGHGVISPNKVAWEMKNPDAFHGFEVYEFNDKGEYKFHAEYVADDNFRTLIDGRIWPKST